MNHQEIFNFALVCGGMVLFGASYSLPTPVYPEEALRRGVSVTQSGIVLGSSFITAFFCTPFLGKLIGWLEPYKIFMIGSLLVGVGNIAFGFLYYVEDGVPFFWLSLFCRFVSALGEAVVLPTAYPLGAEQFSAENQGKSIAVIESCFGIGMVIGPSVGGGLYSLGGFMLPFCLTGFMLVLLCVLGFLLFKTKPETETTSSRETGWKDVFRCPGIVVFGVGTIFTSTSLSWYTASFEPHLLNEFGLESGKTGLVLMAYALTYTLVSPLFGFLMDKGLTPVVAVLVGNSLIVIAYLGIGPVPGLLALQNIAVTVVCLMLHGVGTSCSFIGTLLGMLEATKTGALPQTEQTTGLATSFWLINLYLGSFLGYACGSFSYDNLGFPWSCTTEAALMGVSIVVFYFFGVFLPRRAASRGYQQL